MVPQGLAVTKPSTTLKVDFKLPAGQAAFMYGFKVRAPLLRCAALPAPPAPHAACARHRGRLLPACCPPRAARSMPTAERSA